MEVSEPDSSDSLSDFVFVGFLFFLTSDVWVDVPEVDVPGVDATFPPAETKENFQKRMKHNDIKYIYQHTFS